jgi:hypothetical protein
MKSPEKALQLLIAIILLTLPVSLAAQLSRGGMPVSFSTAMTPPAAAVAASVDLPDLDAVSAEDIQSPLPYRFAINLKAGFDIRSSGEWLTAANGTRVWRVNVKSPGARALILYFDRFRIPEGGKVFVYNPGRTQLLGAFTSLNNNKLSTFATGLIYGDELTLEYDAPADAQLPDLRISEVGHAYRGVSEYHDVDNGFGTSGKCEVNVNCTEGNNWQKEKRSVTRITIKRNNGSVWCTGSLVNNVRNDGKPYIITADHCGKYSTETDLSQWIFYFGYESAACPNPTIEPPLRSMTGATMIAHGGNAGASGSDFFLVLLNSSIPDSFNVYYNGWSRETLPPSLSGVGIHHPQGDIKKISTYTNSLQPTVWTGGSKLSHWQVNWTKTANGHGTTEGGSSGSPLFDNLGRLVGTLTGGDSSCDSAQLTAPDYYGMFSYSWAQNGTDSSEVLKYWLDPDSTNVMSLNGWATAIQPHEQVDLFTIYPNPAADNLVVRYAGSGDKKLGVTIHDILGNLRFRHEWNVATAPELKVDLTGYPSGMYLLGFTDGGQRFVRKILKQ